MQLLLYSFGATLYVVRISTFSAYPLSAINVEQYSL